MRFVVLAALLAACNNPCQDICAVMADYAEDECGMSVSSDQVSECEARQDKELTDEQRQSCVDARDADGLAEWWTCDDLAANFTDGAR